MTHSALDDPSPVGGAESGTRPGGGPGPGPGDPPRPSNRRRLGQGLAYALPVALVEIGAWSRRWVTEDAFIYFRTLDNLLSGHGPVFNAGERVEAGTGIAWTALLAVGRVLLGWLMPVEWISVVLGLALTAAAMVLAQTGAASLARRRQGDSRRLVVPAGALAVAALPPMWEFATSGLETSFELFWLALAFWGLARRPCVGAAPLLAVWIGLGPLIRPDLGLFAIVFLAALWLTCARGWRDRAISGGWAVAMPLTYEVFRMGYYGSVVPNTAIAKSAASSNWAQGWAYLVDFVSPYWLVLPAALCLVLVAVRDRPGPAIQSRSPDPGTVDPRATGPLPGGLDVDPGTDAARTDIGPGVVSAAPVLGALLYGAYVTRLGGDFMHGRFWLPVVFALAMPIAVIPLPHQRWRRTVTACCVIGLLSWAVRAGSASVDYSRDVGPAGIADERGFWVRASGNANPVTLADFGSSFLVRDAQRDLGEAHEIGGDSLVIDTGDGQMSVRSPQGTGTHFAYRNIGVYGVAAGLDTTVVDPHGLSDPLAARVSHPGNARDRPGHEKNLPPVWILARYAAPQSSDSEELRAARHALGCGDLAEMLSAVEEPLTVSRWVRNFTGSAARTRLVVPADPFEAERSLCR